MNCFYFSLKNFWCTLMLYKWSHISVNVNHSLSVNHIIPSGPKFKIEANTKEFTLGNIDLNSLSVIGSLNSEDFVSFLCLQIIVFKSKFTCTLPTLNELYNGLVNSRGPSTFI